MKSIILRVDGNKELFQCECAAVGANRMDGGILGCSSLWDQFAFSFTSAFL